MSQQAPFPIWICNRDFFIAIWCVFIGVATDIRLVSILSQLGLSRVGVSCVDVFGVGVTRVDVFGFVSPSIVVVYSSGFP
jgi:hypothetical protein